LFSTQTSRLSSQKFPLSCPPDAPLNVFGPLLSLSCPCLRSVILPFVSSVLYDAQLFDFVLGRCFARSCAYFLVSLVPLPPPYALSFPLALWRFPPPFSAEGRFKSALVFVCRIMSLFQVPHQKHPFFFSLPTSPPPFWRDDTSLIFFSRPFLGVFLTRFVFCSLFES